tara:strand:- start:33 stop:941 length:909 start_codon:yes stop_codon:yes gene_type:complete
MKKDIKETQKQGWLTLLALVIIAISVSIGFSPLFELIGDGIAARVLGSSFGAIFVIVLTMFLLTKQTEIEQESKKSERVFDEKVQIYQKILDITRDMLMDGTLEQKEINRLPFPLLRLQMLADDNVIKSFQAVFEKLNKIYEEDGDVVEISDDDKDELYRLLSQFSAACRRDLEISNTDIDENIQKHTVTTISNSGKKKKDYTKFTFDGIAMAKNQYIFQVIKNYVDKNPGITIDEFSKKIIERTPKEFLGDRKNDFEIWKTYDEAIEVFNRTNKKRYFVTKRGGDYLNDKDLVLNIADASI